MNRNPVIILIFLVSLLISCKPVNKASDLNYMQNIEDIATGVSVQNAVTTIQPGDQLVIMVSAKDLDVIKPFNQNYSSGEIIQNAQAGGNLPSAGQAVFAGPTYTVDSGGNIDFPVVGNLSTTGKTLEQFKQELRNEITRYIINPTVNVRLANFKVTVLGEVNRPGQYVVSDGYTTLLNAVGLAGDLTMYGKRDDVLVVRSINGEMTKERINLTDASFINSPYYHLKQGDVIYISSNKTREKTARLDPNAGLYIGVASIVVTILALVFKK
ncbi:sugar transporter [Chryseobacterium sp. 6424]|uniref:polysaccharide biosynthesis/export family protein n=1 Tax=Chryseobacterium sp. 6424 TaxID=2039166 RepID=UPI000EFBE206|nr:sugar transporter [Chryseobacterium sp. 6424]